MSRFRLAYLVALGLIVWSCATSPTGRKQLMLASEAEMNQLGAQSFQQMKSQIPVDTSPSLNQYVRCVAMPIVAVSGSSIPADQWEVAVFKDETANAFALPGGKIGVNTGLFKVAKNEAQLATVLGHEVGHVLARHSNERVSQGILAQGGQAALGAVLSGGPAANQQLLGLLGLGVQVGVLMPYGRTQESEADTIGLDLMAKAGFDPRQSVQLWKNMAAGGGGQPPEFLSTHPSHSTRITDLEAKMPSAMQTYDQARASGRAPHCVLR